MKKSSKKMPKRILIGVFVLVLLVFSVLYFYLRGTLGRTSGEIDVKGIKSNVIISRNEFGIPKIDAKNKEDMFFAIGYVHASDRLFQMDMIRRLATGRLSEVMGKRTLNIDKRYKDLMIEESIERSLKEGLPDKISNVINNYCRGVNYFIHNETLPPEFKILGYKPEDWKVKDVLCIFKNMENILASSGHELNNYRIIRNMSNYIISNLIYGTFGTTIINEEEYKSFNKSSSLSYFSDTEREQFDNGIGSNNWVISGKRTATGLPILANDPHLSVVFPSYFYQIYATDSDIVLSGNTIAGLPFIVIGRNKNIGWGFTNVGTDVIDYFILETDKEKTKYKLDGNWEQFKILKKNIKIKGEKDYIHEIKMSKLGPVFEEDGKTFARHSIMLYKSTVLNAFYNMNYSKTIIDFLTSLKQFSSPGQNVVFADTLGTIGYYPTGFIPKRRKGDGSVPVKVTKSEESWDDFIDESKKPFLINPIKGYIATANNMVIENTKLPVFSVSRFPSFRADRINELISKNDKISLDYVKKIQTDTYLKNAEYLISIIKKLKFDDKGANVVFNKLKNWDCRVNNGIEPYLFYKFQRIFTENLFKDEFKDKKYKWLISRSWFYRITNYPKKEYTDEFKSIIDDKTTAQKEKLYDIVKKSLIDTFNIYTKNGKNEQTWSNIHKIYYKHPLGSVAVLKTLLNRGPYFMAGGEDCVLAANFSGNSFTVSNMATFRMIIDFANFSNSVMINSSGQSGHFMSPNYDDQIRLYTNLKYRKMEDFKGKLKVLILKSEK